jgi:hypothetical protein
MGPSAMSSKWRSSPGVQLDLANRRFTTIACMRNGLEPPLSHGVGD